MTKWTRFAASIAAGLLACADASPQRLNSFPAATSVNGTDTLLAQQPSLCAAGANCSAVLMSINQVAAYLGTSGTFQASDADLAAIAALGNSSTTRATTNLGLSLLTIHDAATGRGILGLGTLATQNGTFSGSSSGTNTGDQTITLTGDVTGSGTGSFAAAIAAGAVTNAKLAQAPAYSVKGNNTSAAANAIDLTQAQLTALVQLFSTSQAGVVPASGGGTSNYLRADGTWAQPGMVGGGGTVTSVTGTAPIVSSGGNTPAISINAATTSAAGSMSAADKTKLDGISGTNTGDQTSVSGNAGTATKLATPRTIAITGDLTYTSPAFDGSGAVTAAGTLAASGVTAGTYGGASGSASVTFDAKGRATGASSATLGVAGGGTGRTTSMPILSVSRANGSTAFATVANSFTTIVLNTVAIDTASGYNTSTGIYTVPETGVYLITSKLRLADNVSAGISYGIGVDTANQDGASFFWAVTPTASAQARQGALNFRVYSATAGDQLRLFAYVDNTSGLGVIAAELNMYRVR